MENPITKFEEVTLEKVAYVEEQVQRNLDFHFESKTILTEEAKVTLNWLFGLAITPAGYVFSKAPETPWWIVIPAIMCSLASGGAAIYLFRNALYAQNVFPAGNEPKNLINDNAFEGDVKWLRLAELCNLQERIDVVTAQNERVGTTINNARWAIASITGGSLFLLGILYAVSVVWGC